MMRMRKMIAHGASQGARSDAMNHPDLIAPLRGGQIERFIEATQGLVDTHSAEVGLGDSPDPNGWDGRDLLLDATGFVVPVWSALLASSELITAECDLCAGHLNAHASLSIG